MKTIISQTADKNLGKYKVCTENRKLKVGDDEIKLTVQKKNLKFIKKYLHWPHTMKIKISIDEPLPKGKSGKDIENPWKRIYKAQSICHTQNKTHEQRRFLIRRKIHNTVIPLHMSASLTSLCTQVACLQSPFIKPSTRIHTYDAKDVFELLNSSIRRSSHSTKFGSKESFNLNLRRVPWRSCSWLRGLDSVKLASRGSMTLIWIASSNN